MPELPEVETVRRGLAPHLTGRRLDGAVIRNASLRWRVPDDLRKKTAGRTIKVIARRGKYLILELDKGFLIIHLGMSGSLRLVDDGVPPRRHDHVDQLLAGGGRLRYHDPRRFGAVLWSADPAQEPLLANLGVEPLAPGFDGDWLHAATRHRRTAIKSWLMDAGNVVGIGNIYANEALFHAGIHPLTPAGRLGRTRCRRLADAVQATLQRAIDAGGSTLRDFVNGHGQPGYFQQTLFVYGRDGLACRVCGGPIRSSRLGNRATCFCPVCQKR